MGKLNPMFRLSPGYTPVLPAAQLTRAPVRHSSLQSPGQRGTELGPACATCLGCGKGGHWTLGLLNMDIDHLCMCIIFRGGTY